MEARVGGASEVYKVYFKKESGEIERIRGLSFFFSWLISF